MGISSDHLPVLFHILSNAKDDDEGSRTIWNCRGDGVLLRAILHDEMKKKEKELAQLQRKGNNAQESEYDQLVTNLTTTLKDAGMIAFGKRKTVRSVQSWSKQKEVLQAFSKLKEAESELIDDTNNATKKEKMEEARKQFNDIRTEKENDAWNKIRDKIGKEESRKLLHVLLPHSTANLNLLDIQRPDSSLCNSKAEAAELMVEHYANVCSLPMTPASIPTRREKSKNQSATSTETTMSTMKQKTQTSSSQKKQSPQSAENSTSSLPRARMTSLLSS